MDNSDKDDYTYTASLLFNWTDAVVPRDFYWFKEDDNGQAWILMIKPGVRLIPRTVNTLGGKGIIFHFKDDMTPRPFDEDWGGWKVTRMLSDFNHHTLLMASATHTYFCLTVQDAVEEIKSGSHDIGFAKLSWAPAHSSMLNFS